VETMLLQQLHVAALRHAGVIDTSNARARTEALPWRFVHMMPPMSSSVYAVTTNQLASRPKAVIADIKSHVDAKPGVDWLAVVELPLTVHSGTPQRADLTLIPRQAQTMQCAVVVEVDPALHFRNPSRHRVRQRRGVSALDSARDAACDRDAAKDDRYRALGVHLLRIGEEAWIPGQGLASHWLQLLDSMLDAAAASCI